jgi:hypothetical protein
MDRSSTEGGTGDTAESIVPAQAWQRRLGRIRLGAEPIELQLARYQRATWVVTGVVLAMGIVILVLFAGFGRWDVGLWVAGIGAVPTLSIAWLDHLRLWRAVAAYRREHPCLRN